MTLRILSKNTLSALPPGNSAGVCGIRPEDIHSKLENSLRLLSSEINFRSLCRLSADSATAVENREIYNRLNATYFMKAEQAQASIMQLNRIVRQADRLNKLLTELLRLFCRNQPQSPKNKVSSDPNRPVS